MEGERAPRKIILVVEKKLGASLLANHLAQKFSLIRRSSLEEIEQTIQRCGQVFSGLVVDFLPENNFSIDSAIEMVTRAGFSGVLVFNSEVFELEPGEADRAGTNGQSYSYRQLVEQIFQA